MTRLIYKVFSRAHEVCDYINDHNIKREDVFQVVYNHSNGCYMLFLWEER